MAESVAVSAFTPKVRKFIMIGAAILVVAVAVAVIRNKTSVTVA